ncbi:MAG: hypothetical protein FJZ38_12960 [Candidatus Rokubacteria bacterium]|nr:hypothetical protein [Candidatus Rokubacteria bacterium]
MPTLNPTVVACNAAQHTWLGYSITVPPGVAVEEDTGSGQVDAASQQTLELRVSRYVGEGVREDLDLTNYSQQPTAFRFAVEVDGDFADFEEVRRGRQQSGQLERTWRQTDDGFELALRYEAAHRYDVQDNRGIARITRAVRVRVARSDTEPCFAEDAIGFDEDSSRSASTRRSTRSARSRRIQATASRPGSPTWHWRPRPLIA